MSENFCSTFTIKMFIGAADKYCRSTKKINFVPCWGVKTEKHDNKYKAKDKKRDGSNLNVDRKQTRLNWKFLIGLAEAFSTFRKIFILIFWCVMIFIINLRNVLSFLDGHSKPFSLEQIFLESTVWSFLIYFKFYF